MKKSVVNKRVCVRKNPLLNIAIKAAIEEVVIKEDHIVERNVDAPYATDSIASDHK